MFKDFLKSRILPTRPHRLADCLLNLLSEIQVAQIENQIGKKVFEKDGQNVKSWRDLQSLPRVKGNLNPT